MRTNELAVEIYPSVKAAPIYKIPEFRAAQMELAGIVRNGTEEGNSTVDLIFSDLDTGQKYVAMLTGNLIKTLATMIGDEA